MPIPFDSDTGILLVGHGTREPSGTAQFLALAELVRERLPGVAVEPCFLELAEPTISAAIVKLAERGIRKIVVSPILLFSAGHIQQDIPNSVRGAIASLPCKPPEIVQASHLGCHPRLIELSTRRFHEAIPSESTSDADLSSTGLVMVGRGSRDESATVEMRQFLAIRHTQTPVAQAWLGFVAMAQPTAAEALAAAAKSGLKRIVVQPHLLFAGQIINDLLQQVAELRQTEPRTEWIVTAPLGPDAQLAEAIVELAEVALHSLSTAVDQSLLPAALVPKNPIEFCL